MCLNECACKRSANWESDSSLVLVRSPFFPFSISPQLGRQKLDYEIKDTSPSLFTWEIHSTVHSPAHRWYIRPLGPSSLLLREQSKGDGWNKHAKTRDPRPCQTRTESYHSPSHPIQSRPCNLERMSGWVAYEVPPCRAKKTSQTKSRVPRTVVSFCCPVSMCARSSSWHGSRHLPYVCLCNGKSMGHIRTWGYLLTRAKEDPPLYLPFRR